MMTGDACEIGTCEESQDIVICTMHTASQLILKIFHHRVLSHIVLHCQYIEARDEIDCLSEHNVFLIEFSRKPITL